MSESYTKSASKYVWAQMASRDQKDRARSLICQLFAGQDRRDRIHWLNRRLHTADAIDNFIARLNSAIEAKQEVPS